MSVDVVINDGPIDVILNADPSSTIDVVITDSNSGIDITLGDTGPMGPQGIQGIPGSTVTRVDSYASINQIPPDIDHYDFLDIHDQAVGVLFENPIGTPGNGQKLIIRLSDNGTPQSISWGTSYVPAGIALPATTIAGKWMHMGFVYNPTLGQWMLVAFLSQL